MDLHITKAQYDHISGLFDTLKSKFGDGATGWRCKFSHPSYPWARSEFTRFWKSLLALDAKIKKKTEELIISARDGTRLTIVGQDNITKFCYMDQFEDIAPAQRILTKTQVLESLAMPRYFDLGVLSTITKVTALPLAEMSSDWHDMPKAYEIRKRIIVEDPDAPIDYMIDIVRRSTDEHKKMRDSRVTECPIEYEFSYEYREGPVDAMMFITDFARMIQLINNNPYPTTKDESQRVRDEYAKILQDKIDGLRYKPFNQQKSVELFAPKPFTLTMRNLVDPSELGAVSIFKDYTVTDKADGERMLLFVDKDGNAYLLNNTLDVFKLNINVKGLENTILDGEFIASELRKDGKSEDIFAVFDAYYENNSALIDYPLINTKNPTESRDARAKVIVSQLAAAAAAAGATVEIRMKQHRVANSQREMADACKAVYSADNVAALGYAIDGLIFTPQNLAVLAFYPGKKAPNYIKKFTWGRVFKWKPPEQNTIDFHVTLNNIVQSDIVSGKTYVEATLHVGYQMLSIEPIGVFEGLRRIYDEKYYKQLQNEQEQIVMRKFTPPRYKVGEGASTDGTTPLYLTNDVPLTEEGEVIENDTIVEFAYHQPTEGGQAYWKPLRIRHDKTRKYQMDEKKKTQANYYEVALDVWKSIHEPVTLDMLTNAAGPVEFAEADDDDVYYIRDYSREHRISKPMHDFHNLIIKEKLYNDQKNNRRALLELACGQGSDISRWMNEKSAYNSRNIDIKALPYQFVLGVDVKPDNIKNATEGTYARYINRIYNDKNREKKPNFVFAIGDCAKPLHTGAGNLDKDSATLLKYLFTSKADQGVRISKELQQLSEVRMLKGAASNKFNMVSCMFAVHYFWESEAMFNGFMNNVADNLEPGGLFICTFMDGKEVSKDLEKSPEKIVKGVYKPSNTVIWAIKSAAAPVVADGSPYGKKIEVYLETTRRMLPEYIVDFNEFTRVAETKNLQVKESNLFISEFIDVQWRTVIVPAYKAARNDDDKRKIISKYRYIFEMLENYNPDQALQTASKLIQNDTPTINVEHQLTKYNRYAIFVKK